MLDIQTLSIAIATVSVVAGSLYYSFQIRNQTRVRQTDLALRLYTTLSSKEFQEAHAMLFSSEFRDFNDFEKKYGSYESGKPVHIAIGMVGTFFEGVGLLLHRKLIDISVVDDLFSSPIKMAWEKMKPVVKGLRKEYNLPQVLEWFEYLYNEIQKREQRLQQTQQ